jgi:hypothetical protein
VAPDLEFTKDTKELTYQISTDKVSPPGKHGVFCQVILNHNGETLYQSVGGAELRVDVPLPPKTVAAAPATPTPAPMAPAAPAKPPEKRLSRLEQLRLEQEEREKAAKGEKKPENPPAPKKEEPKKP